MRYFSEMFVLSEDTKYIIRGCTYKGIHSHSEVEKIRYRTEEDLIRKKTEEKTILKRRGE